MPRIHPYLSCLAALLLATAAAAVDIHWPQWRGPERTGRAAAGLAPESWPAAVKTAWSAVVGTGHASPLVQGERVYLFSRLEDRETVSALALADGSLLWRQSYPAPYTMNPAAAGHGKGPKSTPALADGRLFTLGIGGVLTAWRAADGALIWQREFSDRFPVTAPDFGAAMSPIVDGDRLIAHVGGPQGGALAAFDTATGEERWAWSGDGPAYASPAIGELGGVRTLVTQTEKLVVGLEAASGRLLWSLPFTTPWVQNSVTPLLLGELVIVSGLNQGVTALRPVRDGQGGWSVDRVWSTDQVSLYMSSPVPASDRLCGFSHRAKGRFVCLDPADGSLLWQSPGRTGENAALLASGRWLLALTDDGRLTVFPSDTAEYTPAATYQAADTPTWAHPVLLPDGFLVKDARRLIRHRYAAPPAAER